jgi:uncharacterized protein (TIGR03435 family)
MKKRVAALLIAFLALAGAIALAQSTTSAPAFEVASIRPASPPTPETLRSGQFHAGSRIDGAHLDFGYVSLADLLPYAFRVKPYQIAGPTWTRESAWNILANLPAGSSPNQAPEMMQALLMDRFKLAFHRENREQPVYELLVAAGGPKMEVSPTGDFKLWDGSFPGFNFSGSLLRGGGVISGRILDQPNCGQRWEFIPLSMSTFAYALSLFLNRPVVDETGLQGDYKVTLDINANTMFALNQNMARANGLPSPGGGGGARGGGGGRGGAGGAGGAAPGDNGQGPPAPPAGLGQCMQAATEQAAGADGNIGMLFQAVQKLGLKLQQGRAPIETIVTDHLEKTPTEN